MVGITIVKIALFLIAVLVFGRHPFLGGNTTSYFLPIARRILEQGSFNDIYTRDYSSVPPGYPYLLASMDWLTGRFALDALVCLQYLADLLVSFGLLWLGSRFGSDRAGAAAALFWLVFLPEVAISTWITPEAVFSALFIGALLLICVPAGELRPIHAISAGLLFGLATLFRGNTLLLPLAFAGYWVWRRAYLAAALFVLAFGLPIGAWTLRNWVVLGDPIVVSSAFGPAFMQGSDDKYYQHKEAEYPAVFRDAAAAGITKPTVETGSNINRWMFRIGLHNYQVRLRDRGVIAALGHMARKLVYMWYLTESISPREELGSAMFALLVVPLGLWELFRWLWRGDGQRLVAITVGFWIGIHLLVVPVARYTIPIMPLIILAACFRAGAILQRTGKVT